MRELRVVGVDSDGTHVICQDPDSGEKYRIASDERLRAAARGDISRLGQIEIEMHSALRPREIQARIRAGATVAEVAAIAGVTVDKIERFAHPVLLERTRATELAAHAHPLRHDGPAIATLDESVSDALIAYGQNPQDAAWDAWKGEDGYWVVQVSWPSGHAENTAHWRFQPGSHGGTVDPLDDLADELSHPEWIQPRRRLTPVATPIVEQADDGHEEVTVDANSIIGAQRARHEQKKRLPDVDDHGTVAFDFESLMGPDPEPAKVPPAAPEAPAAPRKPTAPEEPVAAVEPAAAPPAVEPIAEAHAPNVTRLPERPVSEPAETVADPAPEPDTQQTPASGPGAAAPAPDTQPDDGSGSDKPRRRKSRKPAVPAWEDVLLGVRSNGNS